jgi:hypothetical protein
VAGRLLQSPHNGAIHGLYLHVNIRRNLQVVTQIATKYSDILGRPVKLFEMFESFKTFEGEPWYIPMCGIRVLILWNRPLVLLPQLYHQPQRGSRGTFQVYPGTSLPHTIYLINSSICRIENANVYTHSPLADGFSIPKPNNLLGEVAKGEQGAKTITIIEKCVPEFDH